IADRNTKGLPKNRTVSEFATISFSKSGTRLFFGTAPILPPKDTTLPDFERVNVDVWNYKDDDLMTVQLFNLERELKRNYLARFDLDKNEIVQLGNEKFERVMQTSEADGNVFYSLSDYGKRVERQWQGYTLNEVYAIDPMNGSSALITKDFKGNSNASYTGKYLLLYNEKQKKYFVYNSSTKQLNIVAKDIPYKLYDEEFDMPDDPNWYGVVKWMKDDKAVLIYDRYDIWMVDPEGKDPSINLTNGRKNKNQFRYVNVDADEKFISPDQQLIFRVYNETDKSTAIASYDLKLKKFDATVQTEKANINNIIKTKDGSTFAFTKETYQHSPDLYVLNDRSTIQLSHINPQQNNYSWGTAELFKWKAYTGKETEGIVYKPEGFDATKKYPMIVYFYERNNNTLFNYLPPAPTPSRLNISFFVSRGYIVFVPDIWYTNGHPGKSAYDYIVSGTRALIKKGFIDSTKLGLQGQSWGGYQTAILITQTNLFAAAWAGAPVVNMFSAYGGIRWESGLNRQFQYEHSQSRIGATPWERKDLYIENSPLFHLPKVKTPLVIMSNDADGAVPWYQGIEFFTAMRRLNKPVWLLSYNGEAHNLVERKNRKDISVREQQYFDWLLKGDKPAKWITDGVPAILKGRDWGLKVE
ncbi:MAG: S9 family peptidase, partial [Bacteroidota bacterium]|nr:S9 family peptidase [Bacteroidota bacterium]